MLLFFCLSTSSWAKGKRCKPGTVLVGFDQENQIICEPLFRVLKSTDPKTFEKEILPWLDQQLATYRAENDDDFLPIKTEVNLPTPRSNISRDLFVSFWLKKVRFIPHYKKGKPLGYKINLTQEDLPQFGFQSGDIITHVNQIPFQNKEAFTSFGDSLAKDKKSISFTLKRDQKVRQLFFDFVE